MSFKEQIVVDCRGHLLGRQNLNGLASVLAKELLNGQKVVCVRTEDINISGSLYRNKLKYANFRRKHMRLGCISASFGTLHCWTFLCFRYRDVSDLHDLLPLRNTNPRQGPFHYRSPAKILWRTIRGMVTGL
eukprot:Skav234987  [mRNA]  locus=scaffold122:234229:236754:+ [translate_table: standard]